MCHHQRLLFPSLRGNAIVVGEKAGCNVEVLLQRQFGIGIAEEGKRRQFGGRWWRDDECARREKRRVGAARRSDARLTEQTAPEVGACLDDSVSLRRWAVACVAKWLDRDRVETGGGGAAGRALGRVQQQVRYDTSGDQEAIDGLEREGVGR